MTHGERKPRVFRSVVLVVVSAVATVLLGEILLQRIAPVLPRRMEADDGIALLRAGDPETLLVGSSHARSFVGIAGRMNRESGGLRRLIPVPLEYGKISSYEWLLEHRVRMLPEKAEG